MSLSGRLSAFFLAALAAVLLGFSTALFLLASRYLNRQVADRLETALDTLVAAAEIDARGVEWEPRERRLTLGLDPGIDQVRWKIRDGRGQLVDHSRNVTEAEALAGWNLEELPPGAREGGSLAPWRISERRIAADPGLGVHSLPHESRHQVLQLTVALSHRPVAAVLRNLALALLALSAATWLVAALAGRWLCRRALAPLSRMATSAREMTATNLDQRLPDPRTGDELEDLGHAFNDLLARLHEAFERQSRFTGDASHQLRTPLTALLGQVEVALRRDRPETEYRRVLELVQRRATHLRQIIESLLFLARAESDAGFPELEVVDLAAWVSDHLGRWSAHSRNDDLQLELDGNGPVWVRIHPALLAQAVDNLLENAFKYSDAGSPVAVRIRHSPGAAELVIADRGCGLSAEDSAHLFEPFYRSPHARLKGLAGVGLGLSVAQRIIDAFGGSIRVESRPSTGSSFTIRLPECQSLGAGSRLEEPTPSPSLP